MNTTITPNQSPGAVLTTVDPKRATELAKPQLASAVEPKQIIQPERVNLTPERVLNQPLEPGRILYQTQSNPHVQEIDRDKEVLNYIRKNYPSWFNWATVVLHTLGAMLPFTSIVPKSISKKIKDLAVNFSRWGVPLVKIHTGLEALWGCRLPEAIARIAPTLFLPILPFFNFQLAYGLSSGINVVLEHMEARIGKLSRDDGFKYNNQKVINGFKSMVNDLMNPNANINERMKMFLALGGGGFMLAGAVPALLFARNSLNSTAAKIFGTIRSIGGFLGDLSIILFSTKPTAEEQRKEKIVGSFFFVPTIMDILQRWINQDSDANEIFNHAKTSLNTIGEVLWSSFSTDRNTKPIQKSPQIGLGFAEKRSFEAESA
ncbi:MAG: hypothetical protein RLZZ361_1550 [Cyanobacteriota bacterium]